MRYKYIEWYNSVYPISILHRDIAYIIVIINKV